MANVYLQLLPENAQFLASAFPQYVKNNGTNFPVSGLAFDAASAENAYWKVRSVNYASGNLTLDIEWYADTASTNAVKWNAQIAAITPATDSQDVETKSFATANTTTTTHLGTTGQRVHRTTITISNLDSIAADDDVWIKITRDAADGADTMTGDVILILATLSYLSS